MQITPTLTLEEAHQLLSTLRASAMIARSYEIGFLVNDLEVSIKIMEEAINKSFKIDDL
jgi:hypothetical protein